MYLYLPYHTNYAKSTTSRETKRRCHRRGWRACGLAGRQTVVRLTLLFVRRYGTRSTVQVHIKAFQEPHPIARFTNPFHSGARLQLGAPSSRRFPLGGNTRKKVLYFSSATKRPLHMAWGLGFNLRGIRPCLVLSLLPSAAPPSGPPRLPHVPVPAPRLQQHEGRGHCKQK